MNEDMYRNQTRGHQDQDATAPLHRVALPLRDQPSHLSLPSLQQQRKLEHYFQQYELQLYFKKCPLCTSKNQTALMNFSTYSLLIPVSNSLDKILVHREDQTLFVA